jgi:PAS domain S-box-containing protein
VSLLLETGPGTMASPLTRLRAIIGSAAAPALSDLDSPVLPETSEIGGKLAGVFFPPSLLAANALISLSFIILARNNYSPGLLYAWASGAVAASLLPVLVGYRRKQPGFKPSSFDTRLHELLTILLGLVWATFPALFFDAASTGLRSLSIALIFGISGIGSLALARTPSSAILFCALIAGSLTLASIKLGGEAGLALGAFSILYSMVIGGLILHSHENLRQRVAAGREIRKQNEIISLLLNDADTSATNWLWETDSAGKLTYVSQRLCELTGKSTSELLGQTLAGAAEVDPSCPEWIALEGWINARQDVDGTALPIVFAGSESWWRLTARPLTGPDGSFAGYRGAAHDITGDRQTETRLIEAKEAAERDSATKSHFLAVMSHELRTPLNAIVGFAELLDSSQAQNLSPEARADHIRTIIESSRHLQTLINDILDATRIERGTFKLVEQEADAAELVEVAVKMCRDTAEKTSTTIIARIIEGVELRGDITRIKQVLINLITNAMKFSNPGGFVNVSFEKTESGGLALAVRDGGVGIRKDDLERIFEPFVQADASTSRRFGGIGLGLSIARKIANLHGGTITLESEYGVGTTARLVLPASRVDWHQGQSHVSTAA